METYFDLMIQKTEHVKIHVMHLQQYRKMFSSVYFILKNKDLKSMIKSSIFRSYKKEKQDKPKKREEQRTETTYLGNR